MPGGGLPLRLGGRGQFVSKRGLDAVWPVILEQFDVHRDEAVDGVGHLARGGHHAGRQREESAVDERVPVVEHQFDHHHRPYTALSLIDRSAQGLVPRGRNERLSALLAPLAQSAGFHVLVECLRCDASADRLGVLRHCRPVTSLLRARLRQLPQCFLSGSCHDLAPWYQNFTLPDRAQSTEGSTRVRSSVSV